MSDKDTPPDPSVIIELIIAFRRSKTMFAALALGVFDALADGPKTVQTLAGELRSDTGGLGRLLDACVGLGLLVKSGLGYANTPAAAAYLCHGSPRRLTGYASYSNDVLWKLWSNLEDAVREGSHRWKQTFGWDGPIFSHFFRTPESIREFLMGMHGFGLISSPEVVAAFDLGRFGRLVDLGGATGHLVLAACQRYPSLRGTIFDLSDAMPLAREIVAASPVADRITFQTGDFFTDPLPEADLFALGRILHDWDEPKILVLLRKVYERLPTGGAVLIAEKLLDDDRTGPVLAQMQSLNMLVCTEGKERTLGEYEALMRQAGFTEVQGRRTAAPLDAVLGFKR